MWQLRRVLLPLVLAAIAAAGTGSLATAGEQARPQASQARPQASKATVSAEPAPKDDYYTKRARKILEREQRARDEEPHPLALAHPNEFVVVCEAGCSKPDVPEIVGRQPKQQAGPMLVTTAAHLDADPTHDSAPSLIECLGGCYDEKQTYQSRAPRPRLGVPSAAAEPSLGEWITSVERSPDAPPPRDKLSPIR